MGIAQSGIKSATTFPLLTAHMNTRIWRSILFALSAIGLGACVEAPTAPKVQSDPSLLITESITGLFTKTGLKRTTPLAKDITVSTVIDSKGGVITIPAAGFELTIPAKAVKTRTKFTVTAIKGPLVAYEFGPHGIQFDVPLTARQNLAVTEWTVLNVRPLVAGYFAERSDLNLTNGTATLSELLGGVISPLTQQFKFRIEHFSGYIVAW